MPGNTANLRKATAARTAAAAARAENALVAMIKEGEPVTFRGLAARAGVSPDFLYRNAGIRARIEHHRVNRAARPEPAGAPGEEHASSVVRTLTAQLADLRRRHREETAALRQALEQAHGENLILRRRLAAGHGPEPAKGTVMAGRGTNPPTRSAAAGSQTPSSYRAHSGRCAGGKRTAISSADGASVCPASACPPRN